MHERRAIMMRTRLVGVLPALVLSLLTGFVFAAAPDARGFPQEAESKGRTAVDLPPNKLGVYYKSPSGWVELQAAPVTQAKSKGLYRHLFVPGAPMAQTVLVFPDAHAPVQITEQAPTFYVRSAQTNLRFEERDWQLVKVETKKDHRELQTTSGYLGKPSFKKQILQEITVSPCAEGVYKITVQRPLEPSEYAFTRAMGGSSVGALEYYDFGTAGRSK